MRATKSNSLIAAWEMSPSTQADGELAVRIAGELCRPEVILAF